MAGGTRARPFNGSAASDVYFAAQRRLAAQFRRALEAYANGRSAGEVAEHAVAGGVGPEDDGMAARVSRGLGLAYSKSASEGINSIAMWPTWQQLHSADVPIDAAGMTLRAHTKAVDFANDRAAEMIKGIDQTTRDNVREVVRDAVALHWDQDKLSERLQDTGGFSEDRAYMIARTETSFAQNAGMIEAGRQARDAGRNIKKEWIVDGDPCPQCEDAAAEGVIDLDEEFGEGGDGPPLHPNCMCEVQLVETDEDEE